MPKRSKKTPNDPRAEEWGQPLQGPGEGDPPWDSQRLLRERLDWIGDRELQVGYDAHVPRAHYADRFSLPSQYVVRVDDPKRPVYIELDVLVTAEGLACISVVCFRREGARPISLEVLREVTIGEFLQRSLSVIASEFELVPTKTKGVREIRDSPMTDFAEFVTAFQRETGQPIRRGKPVDDRRLREAADVYVAAKLTGKPMAIVAEHFGVSRSTAIRYIRRAEQRGYLEEARPQERGPKEASHGS